MSDPEPIKSVVAEAPPAVKPAPVAVPRAAAKVELDGDEVIQLSIKPSFWFIPLVSSRVLLVIVFVAAALGIAMRTGSTPAAAMPFQILAGLAALRLGIATLQWASRLYVLTNRRVMRFRGVLIVDVAECRLAKISAADIHAPWYGPPLRLGTIRMRAAEPQLTPLDWEDVARPQELHEILVRAIRKAQNRD